MHYDCLLSFRFVQWGKNTNIMKLRRFRIVRDRFASYEAQQWRMWWPFWTQLDGTNTHRTVEDAEKYIKTVELCVM